MCVCVSIATESSRGKFVSVCVYLFACSFVFLCFVTLCEFVYLIIQFGSGIARGE